jgi:hypothetical protein
MTARRALALLLALASASCAPPRVKLPSGPGAPASDGAEVVTAATGSCRRVSTITAEAAVSGSVNGRRVPRGRLTLGLAAPGSARLEAVAPFGAPIFIFVARDDDATLLLPRDQRVLEHGRPEAVLEAVAGVPLDASELRMVLTGCVTAPDASAARAVDRDWRVVSDGPNEVYIHREQASAPWRVVAVVHRGGAPDGWRAEYRDVRDGQPHAIRLTSADGRRFDLRLVLSQVDLNDPIPAEAFRIQVPRSAAPITIAELRRSGPLGDGR